MRIAVNGAAGAMGRRVAALAAEAEDMQIVAALESAGHPQIGRDLGELAAAGRLGVSLQSELTVEADVLIDFSVPEATCQRARECSEAGIALVIGTTGLSNSQAKVLRDEVARRVPVLVAANMSLGVNVLLSLVEIVAAALPKGYDVEIIEAHHRRKRDAPSGTAREIAKRLLSAMHRDASAVRYGREGLIGERDDEEIAIHAVRGGDIVGDHTVLFAGKGERLELVHRAITRDVFAIGALQAARYVVDQKPGLYSMRDVLG